MKLGVAFGWQVHPWEDLLALVRRAEELGYECAFVDGDVSMLEARSEHDVLDGWTVHVTLLALTRRIRIGSIRLAHHWNAARLAQAQASAERLAPGRSHFLIAAGDRPIDARFGLELDAPAERVQRLEETLEALRALWRGETVTRAGRYVRLDGARVRPTPTDGRVPIWVAARGPRMLELVAAHADGWEVNLPPIAGRVEAAAAHLERACRERGRDPDEIARSLFVFARVGPAAPGDALAEYRRLHPWFRKIPDAEIEPVLVVGPPAACRERLGELARELDLELPVLDLSGADYDAARRTLDACAPRDENPR